MFSWLVDHHLPKAGGGIGVSTLQLFFPIGYYFDYFWRTLSMGALASSYQSNAKKDDCNFIRTCINPLSSPPQQLVDGGDSSLFDFSVVQFRIVFNLSGANFMQHLQTKYFDWR